MYKNSASQNIVQSYGANYFTFEFLFIAAGCSFVFHLNCIAGTFMLLKCIDELFDGFSVNSGCDMASLKGCIYNDYVSRV